MTRIGTAVNYRPCDVLQARPDYQMSEVRIYARGLTALATKE